MRPSTSSRIDACTATFSTSHARVDSIRDTGISTPPKQMLQKQRWEEVRKLKGSQGHAGKLSFHCPFKLTWNGCRMFRSVDAEVLGGGLYTLTTHGHASFGSPTTHLQCLHDRSRLLQT
jgi:hypothetical protein